MYDLADVRPDTEIDPGTNLLITGPPLTGKRQIAFDILASGAQQGNGSIVVTTKDGADKVLKTFSDSVDPHIEANIGVVDCVTKQSGIGAVDEDPRIKYASSPVDMTGIGIKLSEFLQEFYETRGLTENRVLLHSISTLLMYSNLQTVFRFLHVFTGRIQSADAMGVYVIDSTGHDDQTMNTLKQLFDAVIELEENNDGEEPVIRTAGLSS
ncbi:recombinase RecA [Natronorubrum sp. JWXQ-INN-674]|uniref:Recombinase RecA n=1 Tax=Natronorubrum halalkaliphilum TaxID=2691917 RepID=A0A6B0VHM0_9EURY|nr:recombinase RecA [Natronorubrum halalkaliphilum]MXV61058.1 recombinase RecA [Natronorubrum halalkaliphilum]